MERPLTARLRADGEPVAMEAYERAGGYRALRAALAGLAPEEVTERVSASSLRGRGGAGFPTGKKWSFVPSGEEAPARKYLVANADEMEPGAFKDRVLLEGDPHQLIEGMILAAYAIGARTAYVFLRAEYRRAGAVLARALGEARARGLLGRRILGSGFDLAIHLHASAGRYICGEETALLNALEGRRAVPREKPPFPQLAGLWGRPTIVNNVETLCNVPHIVAHGPEWFQGASLESCADGGTKVFTASGRVRRPGAWELPMGTPLRALVEEHAGGMRAGYGFRGVLPGGGSTDFLVAEHLDTPMDFDSVEAAGSRFGTGTLVVLDDRTCPVGMVRNLERFFAQESCGWCTPCRDGLPWVATLLGDLEAGRGRREDLEALRLHPSLLGIGRTFCAHAPGAMAPLESALRHFADDFAAHVERGGCPYRTGAG